MFDLTLEEPVAFLIIGAVFIIIYMIGIENLIRYLTKKTSDEPTGITKPNTINYLFLSFGIFFFLLGFYIIVIPLINPNPPTDSPKPTQSDTPISKLTPTILPTSTSTIAQIPSITPTLLSVTETLEVNLYSWYDFSEDCIPSTSFDDSSVAAWAIFPSELSTNQDNCVKSDYEFGFISHFKELEIIVAQQPNNYYKGITIDIPAESDSISFEIDFTALKIDSDILASRFYYGFINEENGDHLTGKFVVYIDSKYTPPIYYFLANDPTERVGNGAKEISNKHKIIIDLSKTGYMTIQVDGVVPKELRTVPIGSRKFILGYFIPASGIIDMQIKEFTIH